MFMLVPGGPDKGEKDLMRGAEAKEKPGRLILPYDVVTCMLPEAPPPTTAFITLGEITLKEVACIPPNVTDCTLLKPNPFIVIVNPVAAIVGEKEVICGP